MLRGRGWDMGPDASPFGQSPLVYNGVGSPTKVGGVWARGSLSPRSLNVSNEQGPRVTASVSEPLLLPDGRTRDGNLIERHATDIHEGKPWRKNVPWAPREDYDADVAKDAGHRSDQGTKAQNSLHTSVQRRATDIHEGRPWRRSIPLAPSENLYGQGDPHSQCQPPHMRSEVYSVLYGRQDAHGVPTSFKPPERSGMADLSNPYLGVASPSRTSYARGWNSDLLSGENNAQHAAVEAVRRAASTLSPSPPSRFRLHSRPHFHHHHLHHHRHLQLHCLITPTPCLWQARTLPDANMLWRHQLVESDIRQHYRNPDALVTA